VTGLILGLDRVFGLDMEPIAWFSRFSTAFAANLSPPTSGSVSRS
jgi:arabinogalactan oligomer/maltooligosaccharide transport system permease protein